MKILLGHTFPNKKTFGESWIEDWIIRLRLGGYDVHPFSLVVDNKQPMMYFNELDTRWKLKDPQLMKLYDNLSHKLENYDVFIW